MRAKPTSESENVRVAKVCWSSRLNHELLTRLRTISREHPLRVSRGELTLLDGNWFVTHAGLLRIAHEKQCLGIHVRCMTALSDPGMNHWVFRSAVFTAPGCKGFIGYGDANPSNVSLLVRGAEMRIAETRAVNRALRKAYGIGLCSIEEVGSSSSPVEPASQARKPAQPEVVHANANGHHLRDRLLVVVRKQKLDGGLVKAYAMDFCGVKELREASKEQVLEFINHLSEYATNDRDGLLCQLNSYAPKQESAA